jgi:Domain of unknown function (DUF4277)
MSYRLNALQSGGFSMESGSVERLHHFWVFTSVINDLSCIEIIDARLGRRDQEESTAGEAVAAMLLNGLGFSNRPRSFTRSFLPTKYCMGYSPQDLPLFSTHPRLGTFCMR